jgi:hypothetical protein
VAPPAACDWWWAPPPFWWNGGVYGPNDFGCAEMAVESSALRCGAACYGDLPQACASYWGAPAIVEAASYWGAPACVEAC